MLRIICDALGELLQDERQSALVRVQVRDQVTDQATDQVKRLMAALGRETLSARELLERLELKHRHSFRSTYLTPALKLGLIVMTEPEKPNSSKQKYRAAAAKFACLMLPILTAVITVFTINNNHIY
jgi:ferric-dicitrate binding protein FerR (iron transport regulator)